MTLHARDLLLFTAGSDEQRKRFATDLVDDYKRTGFAKVINHGIKDDVVEKLFALNRTFFSLPEQTKKSIAHVSGPNPQRGWSRVGEENASRLFSNEFEKDHSRKDRTDCREHFDMGSPGDPQFENRWLDKEQLAGFQENMEASFYRLAAVTITLLEALEVGLGLPSGSLTSRVTNAASEFRLLHYPAVDVKTLRNGKINRIWPHFDLGVITLLFQDMSGGLEMQNRIKPQEFNAVVPSNSSEIVSNISETLQRWTNGELRAGLHQVTIPPCMKDKKSGIISDRYSIAFFCKADRHMSVGSLPFFISEACPAVYEDMSAIEYQQRRLQAAY